MQFDYNTKKAAYIRQHGRCGKCGKHLNMIFEDRRGYEGAWTAHDLMALEEGGSNKAYNCVILCITEPDALAEVVAGSFGRSEPLLLEVPIER